MMNIDLVNKIKRLAIIALASDDELIETIVLKGGNAIDLAYHTTGPLSRTSYDLDFSIETGDFADENSIKERIRKTLEQTFLEHEWVIIDYKFAGKPKSPKEALASFWGGYKVTFKVVPKSHFGNATDIESHRRAALAIKPDNSTSFKIEFSKFEYVGSKRPVIVDGYTLYVYTPEMIVFEKLRAICQQLPLYRAVIPSHTPRARARDFYDIHLIMENYSINPYLAENTELIKNIFFAKRVPLHFIQEIRDHKTIHQDNWESVKSTVSGSEALQSFDFYFHFVADTFGRITFP